MDSYKQAFTIVTHRDGTLSEFDHMSFKKGLQMSEAHTTPMHFVLRSDRLQKTHRDNEDMIQGKAFTHDIPIYGESSAFNVVEQA
jgi:hypothetical protein